jgi:Zn-dependent protease with chaperone function
MKTIWQGRYQDGKTSLSREAEIHLLPQGLTIHPEEGPEFFWPYEEIRQTQGTYGGEPVRLERGEGPGESLVVEDTDFLLSLRAQAPHRAFFFHNPGFRRARVWLTLWAALATLALGLGLYKWGIPLVADLITPHVPVSWEEHLGESQLKLMVPPATRLENPRLERAIGVILARLTGTLPHCPYHFHVTVSNQPVINAFALPGGNIVVYRGLLELTHSPEELAGVLANEMQHVLKRHSTRRIIQDSSTGLLISALAGDATGSMAFALESARTLALLGYSRGEEAEADREGMKMVLAAGIQPQGMIYFFQTLKKHLQEPQFLKYVSSHPSTQDRIQKLQSLVAERGSAHPITPLLPEIHWQGLMTEISHSK